MKILFLSFYFEPDLCAGSFRNTSLFKEMLKRIARDDYIHVITTEPNRYRTFKAPICETKEINENYRIDRINVPTHASGIVDQAKSFYIFYKRTFKIIKKEKYDMVYASSSRLFTAFLGKRCAVKNHCHLYLDIRDIFVDTIKDILHNKKYIQMPVVSILKMIENYTFKNASHINLISGGFKKYFAKYKNPTYSFYTNGMDDVFIDAGKEPSVKPQKPYLITYAGNIGSGQGLEKIIPQAAIALGSDYKFRIIGDGSTKPKLVERLKELDVNNVELINPVPRKELIEFYRQSTFLFLHLNDLAAFKKVIPSKVFEYGAFDKPIIAGVAGYARDFVEKNISNHILFAPTIVDDFVNQMKSYHLRFESRDEFKKNFSRTNIDKEMSKSIVACIK